MDCYFCWVNDKVRRPATMMAGQDFEGRDGTATYEFYPVCEDHASTWNADEAVPYPMYKLKYMVNESTDNYMTLAAALQQHGDEAIVYALNNNWTPRPVEQVVADWVSQFHKPEDLVELNIADMCKSENRENTVELLIGFWEHDAGVYLEKHDMDVHLKEV